MKRAFQKIAWIGILSAVCSCGGVHSIGDLGEPLFNFEIALDSGIPALSRAAVVWCYRTGTEGCAMTCPVPLVGASLPILPRLEGTDLVGVYEVPDINPIREFALGFVVVFRDGGVQGLEACAFTSNSAGTCQDAILQSSRYLAAIGVGDPGADSFLAYGRVAEECPAGAMIPIDENDLGSPGAVNTGAPVKCASKLDPKDKPKIDDPYPDAMIPVEIVVPNLPIQDPPTWKPNRPSFPVSYYLQAYSWTSLNRLLEMLRGAPIEYLRAASIR
jgi:hypothetical protein